MRCRRRYRVNQLGLAVHSHMRLHPEVPLLAFPRLMHLGIAFLACVLGRTRSVNDSRVHDRSRAQALPLLLQMCAYAFEDSLSQTVSLQQMAELAHRSFIGHRFSSQIDAHKLPHS